MKPVSRVNPATEEATISDEVVENATVSKIREVANDVAEHAKEYGHRVIEETGSFVRRYPTQTLIAGFGAGILIGMGLARKK